MNPKFSSPMSMGQFKVPPMAQPDEDPRFAQPSAQPQDLERMMNLIGRGQAPKGPPQGPGFSVPSAEKLGGSEMEQAKLLYSLGIKPSPMMQAAAAPPSGDMGFVGSPPLMPPRVEDGGVTVPPGELARRFKSGGMADIPTEKLMSAFIETGAKDQEIMAELVKRLSGPQPGM
jgi:hypothetical protein